MILQIFCPRRTETLATRTKSKKSRWRWRCRKGCTIILSNHLSMVEVEQVSFSFFIRHILAWANSAFGSDILFRERSVRQKSHGSKIWLEKLGTLHCLGKIEHHLDPWSVAQIVNEMKLVMTNNLKLELLGLTLGRFHPSILGADVCSCQSTTAESKWLRWTSQYSMCIDWCLLYVYCMFLVFVHPRRWSKPSARGFSSRPFCETLSGRMAGGFCWQQLHATWSKPF